MKKVINYGHQGDLNFRKIDKLPEGLEEVKFDEGRGGYTLALGEHTGHAHVLVIDRPKQKIRVLRDVNGRHYLDVQEETRLLHGTFLAPTKIDENETDKHNGAIFTPGLWEQNFEEEYDPFTQEIRRVTD